MKHLVIAASLLALFPASQTAMAQTAPAPAGVTAPAGAVSFNAVASHYAALVEASYADTLTAAKTMQQAIDAFAKSPSADTLAAARKAWLAAREFYGQTEAFRFYGGPIDDANGPEGRINAWPMDESYVDGVKSKPDSRPDQQPQVRHQQEGACRRRTSAAAKRTSPPAGTPSSSCCGART